MAKKEVIEPDVMKQISYGYIQTNTSENTDVVTTNLGPLSLLGSEIDSVIYTYNQINANFYMANYFNSNYGENPTINIQVGSYVQLSHMAVYAELWKLNFKLQDAWRGFYQYLNSDVTVRVYNNDPILVSTPSRAGYVVIHPSVQPNLLTGEDEYGAYYEANVGGFKDTLAIINGQYLRTRRLTGRGQPIYL